jgi:hypothetical protein
MERLKRQEDFNNLGLPPQISLAVMIFHEKTEADEGRGVGSRGWFCSKMRFQSVY